MLNLLIVALLALPAFREHTFESPRGAPVKVSALEARVVVVDLWATWCPPCVKALPALDALARDRAAEGVVVLAISQDEDPAKVGTFPAAMRLEHLRVLLDPTHVAARALEPDTLPSTYVLDAAGNVRATFSGFEPGDELKLRAAVDRVLQGSGAKRAEK